ncbi:MAG: sarcosine oxidase subunit gamma [Gammaproteobacteria bacterium]
MAEHANHRADTAQPVARSPLSATPRSGPDPHSAAVCITERDPVGQLVLRGDPDESGFASRAAGVLGFDLPLKANTATRDGARRAIWMGPKEWLIVSPPQRTEGLQTKLQYRLRRHHAAVVDVSHSRVIFGLSGAEARQVLCKGCAIDLHPRVFGPGQCVQTRLARCHMLLHQLDDAPGYDIYIHRSFARYAWAWLLDAGSEYGIAASRWV